MDGTLCHPIYPDRQGYADIIFRVVSVVTSVTPESNGRSPLWVKLGNARREVSVHPITDITKFECHVRKVPTCDIEPLYSDHLVGVASSEGGAVRRRVPCLEIDHQLKFGLCSTGRSEGLARL